MAATYFGGPYREMLMGFPDPGPWLTPADFFRHETSGGIYTHDWTLVSRATQLTKMTRFSDDPERVVAVIVGRGGDGQRRLPREFARTVEQEAAPVPIR